MKRWNGNVNCVILIASKEFNIFTFIFESEKILSVNNSFSFWNGTENSSFNWRDLLIIRKPATFYALDKRGKMVLFHIFATVWTVVWIDFEPSKERNKNLKKHLPEEAFCKWRNGEKNGKKRRELTVTTMEIIVYCFIAHMNHRDRIQLQLFANTILFFILKNSKYEKRQRNSNILWEEVPLNVQQKHNVCFQLLVIVAQQNSRREKFSCKNAH